ncbi:MAG TPA: hypothetical protein VHE35_10480 [Kofleriaceae bacterium]|nr:hypothetical protein [Kofleriaceae bacterium]
MIASLYSAATQAAAAAPTLQNKKVEPTTIDWIGASAASITIGCAVLVLVGMAAFMVYKALTQSQALQTSWNPAQEATFQPYAEVETKIHSKAWMLAFGGAALFAVLAFGIYFGVSPKKDKTGDTMDMSGIDHKVKAPAPAPTPNP